MLTSDQQERAFLPPLMPLRFLVRPERRAQKPAGMESFSESACFHRLHSLAWTFHDADAAALLSRDERATLEEFTQVFESLPWRVIGAHPHISELPGDDLSPLLPTGERLLQILEARTTRSGRFAWLRRLFGLFSTSRAQASERSA